MSISVNELKKILAEQLDR